MKTKLLLTVLLFAAIGFTNSSNACMQIDKVAPPLQKHFSDSIQILFNHNKNVKLSPNPTFDGEINLTCNTNENLFFYLFDMEGTMLYRFQLRGKESKLISKLKKGIYSYDIFENDISIEQGKIIVK